MGGIAGFDWPGWTGKMGAMDGYMGGQLALGLALVGNLGCHPSENVVSVSILAFYNFENALALSH